MPPKPMTPSECDLRGLPFMPLDVVRLVDSDLFALSTGDEFKAAVALWCKSWLQRPAGSLPDDDRVLAHLSGAGSAWPALRAMALRGWVLCADGRFYHAVVAEKANQAWKLRQSQRDKAAKRWPGNKGGDGGPSRGTSRGTVKANPRVVNGEAAGDAGAEENPSRGTSRGNAGVRGAGNARDRDRERDIESISGSPDSVRPRESAAAACADQVVPIMPRLGARPDDWVHLSDKREVEDGVTHAVIGGAYIDVAAKLVCEAARINEVNWAGDWRPLIAWLRDGFSLHDDILPGIRRIAARSSYQPPRKLSYFDDPIRKQRRTA
jgi:hypothetical protein